MRYYIDRDEDGHWYLIPVELEVDWMRYLEMSEEWTSIVPLPEGIRELDSYTTLTFTDPEIS